jgi:transcriptional regulator with PAS, ATPase and Fis domain
MSSISEIQNQIGFFGSGSAVDELIQTIVMVAPTNLSVLISGESGTGKEVVANGVHALSKRKNKKMISVNCGAIPEGILESELFGHEKGSFTGAIGQKKGYFEAANGGAIFLDEIGEMSLTTQVKLLRVLETAEFMRVGGTTSLKTDVRIIAATNKNLEKAVDSGEFRRDLFFRLKAITIKIPPLRERKQDIKLLANVFAESYSQKNNIRFKGFSPDSFDVLSDFHWPGNVRELKNFVETAIILNKGETVHTGYVRQALNLEETKSASNNLPVPLNKTPEQAERELIYRTLVSLKLDISEIKSGMETLLAKNVSTEPYPYDYVRGDERHHQKIMDREVIPATMNDMEKKLIKDTLQKYEGSRRKTALALQISERTLYRKIKEYGL